MKLPWMPRSVNVPCDTYRLALPRILAFLPASDEALPDGTFGNPALTSLPAGELHEAAIEDMMVIMGIGSSRMVLLDLVPSWLQRQSTHLETQKAQKG